jgi:hypothetical protein
MKMDYKKLILDKYPLYWGNPKLKKVHFLTNFGWSPPQMLEQKNVSFRPVFKKNLPTKANDYC